MTQQALAYTNRGPTNSVYAHAVKQVMMADETPPVGLTQEATRELHPAMLSFTDPGNHVVSADGRPINYTFARVEVLWILSGRNDVGMLAPFNDQISSYSDDGEIFNAAYGKRMRRAGTNWHDQLNDVIGCLRSDPASRQAVMSFWDPAYDKAFERDGSKRIVKDRACNVTAHLMIRNGALDWTQFLRSNDALWGLPYNLVQWCSVMAYVAEQLHVPLGVYTHVPDSLHVYARQYDEAQAIGYFDIYQHAHALPARFGGDAEIKAAEMYLRGLMQDVVWGYLHVIRNSDEMTKQLGSYWADTMRLAVATLLYKSGRHDQAAGVLTLVEDEVARYTQLRCFKHYKWKFDDELVATVTGEADNAVKDWIARA